MIIKQLDYLQMVTTMAAGIVRLAGNRKGVSYNKMMYMKKTIFQIAIIIVLISFVFTVYADEKSDVLKKLGQKTTVQMIDVYLRDVIAFLREKYELNIVFDQAYAETIINIELHDVSLGTIIKYILPKPLDFAVGDEGVIQIAEKNSIR